VYVLQTHIYEAPCHLVIFWPHNTTFIFTEIAYWYKVASYYQIPSYLDSVSPSSKRYLSNTLH